jgi:cobalt/nickel transport system ATP-binding protein
MLNIENLTVTYPDGTVAVDHLSLHAEEGEHIALIGANGAGKTSLMLAIEGVLASEGTICVDGTTLSKQTIPEIRKKTGLVFQNPDDQLFMPTIYDDIAFGPRNAGMDEESVRYRVEDRLRLLGIEALKDKTALKLSGGEKRMAALATVLAMKPCLMLLDEPTAFLDPKARRKLIGILKSLPHTMLISTHDLAFALEICPRSILLKEGAVFADERSSQLLYDKKRMEDGGVEAIGIIG